MVQKKNVIQESKTRKQKGFIDVTKVVMAIINTERNNIGNVIFEIVLLHFWLFTYRYRNIMIPVVPSNNCTECFSLQWCEGLTLMGIIEN